MRTVAFVATTDTARARAFYEGVLGLECLQANPAFVELPGLRVTAVESFTPQPFTVLGWDVEDITARVRELVAAGVTFTVYDGMGQDADGIWTAPSGTLVAWFTDPDGNVLSLSQPPG